MNNLIIEYRDPIFGMIVIFILIFLISFSTYSYSIYKEKKARREYRKLSLRFQLGKLKEEDYVHLYKTYNLPFDSILLLASSFVHKGDYNKAISVYLTLLEHITEIVKKEELLQLLGTTYFKGGFLQRAKEIFLKILKFSPDNKNVLNQLLIIYEKLKEYEKAKEVVSCLEELGLDMEIDKTYINTLMILNDSILSYDRRTQLLYEIFINNKMIERIFANFLIQFNKNFFWENINKFDCTKLIDILWYLHYDDINFEAIKNNDFLLELYSAKGYIDNKNHSNDFDLDILIMINKHSHKINACLDFEFICKSCKSNNPFFETRCPHCQKILTFDVKYNIAKANNENHESLQ